MYIIEAVKDLMNLLGFSLINNNLMTQLNYTIFIYRSFFFFYQERERERERKIERRDRARERRERERGGER